MPELAQLKYCGLADGSQLAWREWGSGRPVVMLHGWSMSSVVFSEVAALLADEYRLLCPDLPGHGYSDPLNRYSMESMAAAIAQWAERLQLADFALLGWSLGGQVAIELAATCSTRIDRLLLISTTPCFCRTGDWFYGLPITQVKALLRNLDRAYEKTQGDFFNLQFTDEDLPKDRYRQILKFAVRAGRLPEPEVAKETLHLLGQADLRSSLDKIKRPTLVMHGELDRIIPLEAGAFLAEQLSNTQFHRLPQVGHAPFFSYPSASAELWRTFLQ